MVAVSMGEGGEGDGTAEMEVVAGSWCYRGGVGGGLCTVIGVDSVDWWVAVGGWSGGGGVEARGIGDRVDQGTRNAFGLGRKTHRKFFSVAGGGAGAAVVAAGNLREKK
ncbi:hypothetical protein Tco_1517354 [Tanacetum coccineum]